MNLITSILIGIGLAMDCFAVSLASGAVPTTNKKTLAMTYGLLFGIFQMGMIIVGWAFGSLFIDIIAPYDHWVAFFILLGVGVKMIFDGLESKAHPIEPAQSSRTLEIGVILLLSIATSIDAFAIGIGFAFLDVPILVPSFIIGIIATIFSVTGIYLGARLSEVLGKRIEILGGLILIGIGINILIEHLL
jgi:putative Mn2+ efflux pump MntP